MESNGLRKVLGLRALGLSLFVCLLWVVAAHASRADKGLLVKFIHVHIALLQIDILC